MAEVRIHGIRHHGPGSSRALSMALDAFVPDCVLLEGPPEADGILAAAAMPGMVPPIALFTYRVDDPRRHALHPYAGWSPEWVAMRHALDRGAPVRMIDLPQSVQLADGFAPSAHDGAEEVGDDAAAPRSAGSSDFDPIGRFGELAGHAAGGRDWWEANVEEHHHAEGDDVLGAVAEAMGMLVAEAPPDALIAMRDAHMRQGIRRAVADGHARISVVCGAWHAPALARHAEPGLARGDAALLKGLAKVRVVASWTPWSNERLILSAHNRAGVDAPEWYATLWAHGSRAPTVLAARAAALLRGRGVEASPASTLETVRLADAMAALRGRASPSLHEVGEAILAVSCNGDRTAFDSVRHDLLVGDALGTVPEGATSRTPVEADFDACCKALRLSTGADRDVDLDLRKDLDLARSRFLHRMSLVGIPWGRKVRSDGKGTFKESWTLRWKPEWVVELVTAAIYGPTVAEAAAVRASAQAIETPAMADLAAMLSRVVDADLPFAVTKVLDTLDERAALSADSLEMLRILPPLAPLARYGSVRGGDADSVLAIVRGIVPRAAAGLVQACLSLDDASAAKARDVLQDAGSALSLLGDADLSSAWSGAMLALADCDGVHGTVAGRAVRLLLDSAVIDGPAAGRRLALALSGGAGAGPAAAWLGGFLEGGGAALVNVPGLLGVVDDWLCGLGEEDFKATLPLVRRACSSMASADRRQVVEALRTVSAMAMGTPREHDDADGLGTDAGPLGAMHPDVDAVMPILGLLLGPMPERSAA